MDSRVDRCGDEIIINVGADLPALFMYRNQRQPMTHTLNHGATEITEKSKRLRIFVTPWIKRILLWFLPLSFLIVAFFFPLSKILGLTFNLESLNVENLNIAFRALRFTFYQAILSTILTLILGLPSPPPSTPSSVSGG